AWTRFALAWLVQHIIGQQRQHAFVVAGVEALIVLLKYCGHGDSFKCKKPVINTGFSETINEMDQWVETSLQPTVGLGGTLVQLRSGYRLYNVSPTCKRSVFTSSLSPLSRRCPKAVMVSQTLMGSSVRPARRLGFGGLNR